jgi:hypothetical protein
LHGMMDKFPAFVEGLALILIFVGIENEYG